MNAEKAQVGKKYLNKTGVPVTMLGIKGEKVILRVEISGNEVTVPKDYALRPYEGSKVSKEAKLLISSNGKSGKRREESLAAMIDPMLLAGGKTVQEIAAELVKKAGALAKGKDVKANVRARMVSYTRKGWRVVKDAEKRVRVVQR